MALYVLAFPYHPGLRSPNELCRLWQTRAIVEYGELNINQAIRDYGYVGDLSVKDRLYYPSKAPLLSFAAVPLYKVLSLVGGGYRYAVPELALIYFSRLFLTVLPTLLLLVLLRRFLRAYVSPGIADAVTVTYALGTLAFSYSLLFMSHQPSAVLVFVAFFLLWRRARGEWGDRAYLLAGAAVGAAITAEYTAALPILGVIAYGVLSVLFGEGERKGARVARALALAVLGAAPFVAALMAYHQVVFGHPLDSGYKYLADAAYQPWHVGGFLGIRFPDPYAFAMSFFSPLRGLFILSPALLLGIAGLGLLRRTDRAIFWSTVLLSLGYAYFTSSFSYESWGWTTGPRHLTAWVPFLMLPVALSLKWASGKKAWLMASASALCAVSISVTGAVTFVNYVPDSVSNALAGLALPLMVEGYLPPSLLGMVFLNPWSGAVLAGMLVLAAFATLRLLSAAQGAPLERDAAQVQRTGSEASAAAGDADADPSSPDGPSSRVRRTLLISVAVAVAWVAVLGLAGGDSDGDRGAQNHLRSVWIAPPGATFDLWPSGPRPPG